MNTLHNVGKQVSSFELYDQLDPITGITLIVGDDGDEADVYKAGDETGTVLEVYCPYGNQTMANNLLSQLQGQVYAGFRAQNAILSPAAELGDWVTVNDGTYMLAYRSVTFGPGHMAEIAAPGESTQEHEYGWTSPETRKSNFNQTRSLISKTNDMIQLALYGEDGKGGLSGRMNTFTMSLSGISGQIEGYKDTVTGYEKQLAEYRFELDGYSGEVSKYSETVDGYTKQVISYEGTVDVYKQTVAQYSEDVKGYKSEYSTISQTFKGIKLEATNDDGTVSIQLKSGDTALGTPGTIDLTGLVTFTALENGPDEDKGQTVIDGGWLTGVKISGTKIYGGEYWDTGKVGCLDLAFDEIEIDGKKVGPHPWLTYSAKNSEEETVKLFEVMPITEDYGWVNLSLGGAPVLSVWDGKLVLSELWDSATINANYTAVFA